MRIGTAHRDDLAGWQNCFEPRDPGAGDAVFEGVRAAGVCSDVAADLRLLGRPGIRREEETALADDAAQLGGPEACLDEDPPEQRIERANAREPLERDDDPTVERHGPGGEAGSSSARDDRNAAVVTPPDNLGYLVGGSRHDDGVGAAPDSARLGLVGEVGRGSAIEDGFGREERAQLALHDGGRHAIVTVVASCCDSSAAVKRRWVWAASAGVAQWNGCCIPAFPWASSSR